MRGENGIAELLFQHVNGRLEMEGHPKFMGDGLRLIDMTAAAAADIDFLKAHNVGLAGCDDADNAPRR